MISVFDRVGNIVGNSQKDKILVTSIYFAFIFINPFPNKPWFLLVCNTSPLKALWEKEKLLVTSNFLFPVFSTGFKKFLSFSLNLKLSSPNSFNLEGSKIWRLGKGWLMEKVFEASVPIYNPCIAHIGSYHKTSLFWLFLYTIFTVEEIFTATVSFSEVI